MVGSRTDKARRKKKGWRKPWNGEGSRGNDRHFERWACIRCHGRASMPVTRWTTNIRPANSDYPGCVRGTTSPFNAAARACSSVCRDPLPLVGNREEESGDYDFVARGHESGSRPTSFADSAGIPRFRRIPIAGLWSSNAFLLCLLCFSFARVTRLSSPRVSIRSAEMYSAVPEDDNRAVVTDGRFLCVSRSSHSHLLFVAKPVAKMELRAKT